MKTLSTVTFNQLIRWAIGVYLVVYFFDAIAAQDLLVFTSKYKPMGHQALLFLSTVLGVFAGIFVIFGKYCRVGFGVAIFSLFYLNGTNPYVSHVSISLQILMYLSFIVFLKDERKFEFSDLKWTRYFHWLISFALFNSGVAKLFFPYWISGEALSMICKPTSPIVQIIQNYCQWPATFFSGLTYLALGIELISIFVIYEKARKYILTLQALLFLGILTHVHIYHIVIPLFFAFAVIALHFRESKEPGLR